MKKIKLLVLFILLLGLTGCNQKYENGEVNVFNWSEYIPDSVIRQFEKEYDIKVNYSTYSSNEECLAKVMSSKTGTYDILVPSDYMVDIMLKKDLLEKIDTASLTNFSNLDPNYLNQSYDPNNDYSVPFIAGGVVIAVNKQKIEENITSYNDLLNPKYKDSIVLLDDERVVIGIALKANGYSLNDTNDYALAEAKEFLLELKPNIKLYDSDNPKGSLITEEASIGVIWNAEAALAMGENSNIEIVFPKEGIYKWIDNIVISKRAKKKENALKFINYILNSEVMKRVVTYFPYKNVNQETNKLLSDSYLNNEAMNIPDRIMNNGEFVIDIGENITKYDRLWSEIK